ncbi:phage tail protein [Aeromonas dhakensis]|uniref:phage tail-collar fiber domain-containing protein n=1 Tax=Aeromonas dhakensis TaxID=196024 RepID=UPI0038D1C11C
MSQVITNAFEYYWQSSLAAEQPVVLDEFILADIPNLDITSPIDPDTGLPPESQIVHRQNVDQRGRINKNAVAYTIVMDTTVGDFSFNAMYLRNKQNGVTGMIVYKGRETKLKTDQTTGQTGNSLVKSMLMGYDQAAEATLTHVDAGTWQIDYAARLRGQDEDLRQLASQLYGHHTFIGDGFKVVQQDGAHHVTPGVAIVGGLRIELKQPQVIYPGTKPIGVWVDVHRSGSLLSEHQNHFTIITSVADLTDHVDESGYPHYVAKLAIIGNDGNVEDSRGFSDSIKQQCSSISKLRGIEPSRQGQHIEVESYYDNWAVIVDGAPKFGGKFWFDKNDTSSEDDGFKVIVTKKGARWKRVKGEYSIGHAGAIEDINVDSTNNVQAAIKGTKPGAELGFYGGPYRFEEVVAEKPIVLVGDADLLFKKIRIKTSDFTSRLSGKIKAIRYEEQARAFQCAAYEEGVNYKNIKILFPNFEGFFYSTDLRGRAYAASKNDPTNRVLKNTLIMGGTSEAPYGLRAGHFQHTGVTNAKCIGCSTYGGINATSYNFINGNGYIIVQGCYDHDNLYGSLEIENNNVSYAIISGNAFGSQLWIDDTSNVSVTANVVSDRILITAQTDDTNNIVLSGNSCARISITKFGKDPTGRHKSVHVVGNTTYGGNGQHDLFADDSVDGLTVEVNKFNGENVSSVAVVRSANCDLLIRNNKGKRPLVISGEGGRVVEYGNDGMKTYGDSDSRHLSNLMIPNKNFLDLPGQYLYGTKYTGSIAPSGSAELALDIPDSGDLAFRSASFWVMIRDAESNNVSSFRQDALYKVVGNSIGLNFGQPYSTMGVDADAIVLSNASSSSQRISVAVKSKALTKNLQVTVVPCVSSKFGLED